MKKQTSKILVLLCCMTISMASLAQNSTEEIVELNGSWNYSLPDAPYEYQEGIIEFKNTDGKLSAKINVKNSSSPININDIKKNKDDYTCSFNVDGYDVKAIFKPKTDKITGTVVADNWEMPITLTQKKK